LTFLTSRSKLWVDCFCKQSCISLSTTGAYIL